MLPFEFTVTKSHDLFFYTEIEGEKGCFMVVNSNCKWDYTIFAGSSMRDRGIVEALFCVSSSVVENRTKKATAESPTR